MALRTDDVQHRLQLWCDFALVGQPGECPILVNEMRSRKPSIAFDASWMTGSCAVRPSLKVVSPGTQSIVIPSADAEMTVTLTSVVVLPFCSGRAEFCRVRVTCRWNSSPTRSFGTMTSS